MFLQETQRLQQEPVAGIAAVPHDGNARYFHITIAGPEGVCIFNDAGTYKTVEEIPPF